MSARDDFPLVRALDALNGGPSALDEIDALRAALAGARIHHRTRQTILRYSCYYGECDGHGDDGGEECPLVDIDCCAACLDLAQEINDEIAPDRAMADSCPVLVALELLDGAR
jgi:hypothetical protein